MSTAYGNRFALEEHIRSADTISLKRVIKTGGTVFVRNIYPRPVRKWQLWVMIRLLSLLMTPGMLRILNPANGELRDAYNRTLSKRMFLCACQGLMTALALKAVTMIAENLPLAVRTSQ